MIFQECPSRLTHCKSCKGSIAQGSLRITARTAYYHLPCLRLPLAVPLTLSDFRCGSVTPAQIRLLQDTIRHWNQRFLPCAEMVADVFQRKAVATAAHGGRRAMLEAVAFLAAKDVECGVAQTNKDWFHISRDEELWNRALLRDFHPVAFDTGKCYRTLYIACQLSTCWHCRKPQELCQIAFFCTLYNRPLCKDCLNVPKCQVVPVSLFRTQKVVAAGTIRSLHIPQFSFKGERCSYLHVLVEKVLSYAEARKRVLVDTLATQYYADLPSEEIEEMRNFNLRSFYENNCSLIVATRSPVERELALFCGSADSLRHKASKIERLLHTLRLYRSR